MAFIAAVQRTRISGWPQTMAAMAPSSRACSRHWPKFIPVLLLKCRWNVLALIASERAHSSAEHACAGLSVIARQTAAMRASSGQGR